MHALPRAGHDHHAALLPHVDALAELAAALDRPSPEVRRRLIEEHRFIVAQLLPHMERAEATVYPELERLMQNRHSMTPMRREHDELRRLVGELGSLLDGELGPQATFRLRRILYRMFALLRTHLGEEQSYLSVLDGNLSDEEQRALVAAMQHEMAAPA